jgi:hypothetical protein
MKSNRVKETDEVEEADLPEDRERADVFVWDDADIEITTPGKEQA